MTITQTSYNDSTSVNTAATAAAATTSSASNASNPLASLSSDFQTFLQLLTTQLQNQDPLSPEDPDQFTQQLVEMSGVEQQITGNQDLNSLVTLSQNNASATYVGMIGQTVTASSSQIALENGNAQFSYTLPSAASSVNVTVQDANGNTVATLSPSGESAGTYNMSWDGTGSDGSAEPSGAYTLSVNATDASGNAITGVTSQIIGTVTGVQSSSSGGTLLDIGPVTVNANTVSNVTPGATQPTTLSSSSISGIATDLENVLFGSSGS